LGLAGKTTGQRTETNNPNESPVVRHLNQDIDWGSDSDDLLNRTDLGLQMGGGVELGHLQVRMNYSMGLTNLSPSEADNGKIHNRTMSVSLVYLFLK